EMVTLPDVLDRHWALRGYYGTINHNVKATYVKYLGWYDGNPANLHPLPPVESDTRYVALMGGADAVLARAQEAYDRGEYRWVCQIVNHVVFADPANTAARELQAAALEQLGYQSESGPWRNIYLSGAQELRWGTPDVGVPNAASPDTVRAMPVDLFFSYLAIRLNGEPAGGLELAFSLHFHDTREH